VLAAAMPTCARADADASPLCGRIEVSRWTSRRSDVTCAACLREIDRRIAERAHQAAVQAAHQDPILCDYCDTAAVLFIPRGGAGERSFACDAHQARAGAAVGSIPGQARMDDPLPGRRHFVELGTTEMLARWRAHREALASARG